jgi:hypothetical protein
MEPWCGRRILVLATRLRFRGGAFLWCREIENAKFFRQCLVYLASPLSRERYRELNNPILKRAAHIGYFQLSKEFQKLKMRYQISEILGSNPPPRTFLYLTRAAPQSSVVQEESGNKEFNLPPYSWTIYETGASRIFDNAVLLKDTIQRVLFRKDICSGLSSA